MADDFDVCPYANDGHATDDPGGGPCSACWENVVNEPDVCQFPLADGFCTEPWGHDGECA